MEHVSQSCFDALRRGEPQACEDVFRHYQAFARHVTRRCGVSDMTQDDVIQNAFLKLYQHAAQLQNPQSIAQWLAVTIRNLCFDEFRRVKRASRVADQFSAHQTDLGSVDNSPSDGDLFEGQIYAEAIKEMDQASGGQTLREFYFEGLSVDEIAKRNKEAIGSVTARLSRVRKKLRAVLLKKIKDLGETP